MDAKLERRIKAEEYLYDIFLLLQSRYNISDDVIAKVLLAMGNSHSASTVLDAIGDFDDVDTAIEYFKDE